MVDQEKFQVLSEEWSALVDLFLETPEGRLVIFGLKDGEEEIFKYILQDHADLLAVSTDIEAQAYFKQQRHAAFEVAVNRLEEAGLKGVAERRLARLQCANLRNAATKVANKIRETRRALEAKPVSEIPLSDDVRRALDIASQPGFDVSRAIEDAPDGYDPKEAEKRETRPAPKEEMDRLLCRAAVDTPIIEPPSALTVPVEGAKLGGIKGGNLNELLRAYSQAPCALDSNPPPAHVSRYPALPPPAPKDDELLGRESSIPPPVADAAGQFSSGSDAEIEAGDLLDQDALDEVRDAEHDEKIDEAFDNLGLPRSSPKPGR